VIPLFWSQATDPSVDAITLTSAEMTRFSLTLRASVQLVEKALQDGRNGETWVSKAMSMRIVDVADFFSVVAATATRVA
jgi:FlaA1/EpsC-like NDP-sugar epimerase